MTYGMAPISNETAHGDKWAARIRAQHYQLGAKCPCGNGASDADRQRKGFNDRRGGER